MLDSTPLIMSLNLEGTALISLQRESVALAHVSEGGAWSATTDGSGRMYDSDRELSDDLLERAAGGLEVRLLGSISNAPLICRLLACPKLKVKLGTPRVLQKKKHIQADPRLMTQTLSLLDHLPPSCGGWREARTEDIACYNLCVSSGSRSWSESVAVERWMNRHPARQVANMFSGIRGSMTRLLGTIRDPRWFVNYERPDQMEPLFYAFHCRRKDVKRAQQKGTRDKWLSLVTDAWRGGKLNSGHQPLDFFHYVYRVANAKGRDGDGEVAASQALLSLIQQVWLDSMSEWELFVPEHFFGAYGRPDVAQAWRKFAAEAVG